MDAGVTNDVIVTAIAEMEEAAKPTRSSGAERQARYLARKKASQASQVTENDGETVLSPPSPSFSPTPPITTPSTPISGIQNAREPSKPSVSRGTRMPEGFVPIPNVIEDARNRGLTDSEIADELDAMKVWAANAGSKGFKKDWDGFARIWLRKRAAEKKEKANGKATNSHKPNSIAGGFDIIDRALEERFGGGQDDNDGISRLLKIAS